MKTLADLPEPIREEYVRVGKAMAKKMSYYQAFRSSGYGLREAMAQYQANRIIVRLPGTHRKKARFIEGYQSPQGLVVQFVGNTSEVEFEILPLWGYLCDTYSDFASVVAGEVTSQLGALEGDAETLLSRFLRYTSHTPGWSGDEQTLYVLARQMFPEKTKIQCQRLAEAVQEYGSNAKFGTDVKEMFLTMKDNVVTK